MGAFSGVEVTFHHISICSPQRRREEGEKKNKTKNNPLPGATPVVQIVHGAVIQQQKCAVNAGKQRN